MKPGPRPKPHLSQAITPNLGLGRIEELREVTPKQVGLDNVSSRPSLSLASSKSHDDMIKEESAERRDTLLSSKNYSFKLSGRDKKISIKIGEADAVDNPILNYENSDVNNAD